MPYTDVFVPEDEPIVVDLRNPFLAGLLAWLVPGLGHYYQRRFHKALIFFVCIVPLFIVGCALGSSREVGIARNVYWSWRDSDWRYWWLAHAPLGLSVIPSGIQAWQINAGQQPMFGSFMAPPQGVHRGKLVGVPPVIDEVRQKLPHYELGTYFVVIAGLMNLLVIFDAVDGPIYRRRKG
jgi:hypothetical protein